MLVACPPQLLVAMNLRDLEYLDALHRHGHFGRAAEACFISQPTLSAQFRKLEKEIGVNILDRTAKGVVFSEAGLAVLERAKSVLRETESIREIGRHFKDPKAGTLRVGLIPTIGPYLLPIVLSSLRESFPRLRFRFQDSKTEDTLVGLREGDLDIAVLALPLNEDGLEEIPIYEEPFQLGLSKHHPRSKEKFVTHWLEEEELMLLEEGHCFGHQALSLCSRYGQVHANPFRGTSLEILRAVVAQGEGVTPVPYLAARQWSAQNDDLTYLPFPNPIPKRQIGLMCRQGNLRMELYTEIAKVIKKSIKRHLPSNRKPSDILPVY
jgi:LysR family transcriptional regulator, hydrogen peroxide-inducible genes activator